MNTFFSKVKNEVMKRQYVVNRGKRYANKVASIIYDSINKENFFDILKLAQIALVYGQRITTKKTRQAT